jgi:Alpha galactosidase C-terminal beta sandwich domain
MRRDGDIEVWTRSIGARGDLAIAALNRGGVDREVRVALDEVGVAPGTHVRVRDLWKRIDVGEARREIVIATSANSATVLGISKR